MSFNDIYKNFSKPEINGKKIGLYRTLLSIFGGLLISYLLVSLIPLLIPNMKEKILIISLYLHTLIWACCILWIALAPSKLIALYRVLIPSIIFSVLIFIL